AVATAEEVEDRSVVTSDRFGVEEVLLTVRSGCNVRVPHHTREDPLGEAAEVRAVVAHLDVAGTGEKHYLAGGQHGGVHGQHLGGEMEILPGTGGGRFGVEVEHPVQTRVLANRVVDEHRDQLVLAADLHDGNPTARVLEGEPSGHHGPRAPPV